MIVALLFLTRGQIAPPTQQMYVGNWSIELAERKLARETAYVKKLAAPITDPLLKKFFDKVRKGVYARWDLAIPGNSSRSSREAWFRDGWTRWVDKGSEPIVTDGVVAMLLHPSIQKFYVEKPFEFLQPDVGLIPPNLGFSHPIYMEEVPSTARGTRTVQMTDLIVMSSIEKFRRTWVLDAKTLALRKYVIENRYDAMDFKVKQTLIFRKFEFLPKIPSGYLTFSPPKGYVRIPEPVIQPFKGIDDHS